MGWVTAVACVQSLARELPHAMGTAKTKYKESRRRQEVLGNIHTNAYFLKKNFEIFLFSSSFFFFAFLRLQVQHMEVSRLGVKLELQLSA